MKNHAKFGSPSSLYRLEKCPGSVTLGRDIPDPPPSKYAEEGTEFHRYMEMLLPDYLSGIDIDWLFHFGNCEYPDMQGYVESTLLLVKKHWEKFKKKNSFAEYFLELPISISDEIYGTADVVFKGSYLLLGKRKHVVEIIDFKYGKNVRVSTHKNLQLIAYLIGAIESIPIKNKRDLCHGVIKVAQVRLENEWPEASYVWSRLNKYKKQILQIVEKVKAIYEDREPLELHAGQHCFFCKSKYRCPEYNKGRIEELQGSAEDLV